MREDMLVGVVPTREAVNAYYRHWRNATLTRVTKWLSDTQNKNDIPESVTQALTSGWKRVRVDAELSWIAWTAMSGVVAEADARRILPQLARFIQRTAKDTSVAQGRESVIGKYVCEEAPDWIVDTVGRINATIDNDLGEHTAISRIRQADQFVGEGFASAAEFLSTELPDYCHAFQRLVSHLCVVDSGDLWSCSSPYAVGIIFVNPRSDWSLEHFVETLLHESAHIELMIRQTIDRFVVNAAQLVATPLRDDPRPITGLLHQAFVLSRTCPALRLLGYHASAARTGTSMFEEYIRDFGGALRALRQHAQMTDRGLRLLANLELQYGIMTRD